MTRRRSDSGPRSDQIPTRDLEQHWIGARDLLASRAAFDGLAYELLPAGNQEPAGDLNGLAGSTLVGWALDPRIDTLSFLLPSSTGMCAP